MSLRCVKSWLLFMGMSTIWDGAGWGIVGMNNILAILRAVLYEFGGVVVICS